MYERDLGADATAGHTTRAVRLLDWEQSEAWQLAYGFSQFHLVYLEQVWTIGRLGERYFRVREKIPTGIETILTEIDRARRLLILSSVPLKGLNLNEAGISFRMQGSMVL